jgi:pimeloyl-ACP methyl ester carboxylesterase
MLGRLQHGDGQLAYRTAGTGETVLLLHGSAGSHLLWRRLSRALEARYLVIAPDLWGYGQSSPWPDMLHFGLAEEMAPLWHLLPEDSPLHIVGYSYGAVVALGMALAKKRPLSSLALIEPVAFRLLSDGGDSDLFDQVSSWRRRFEAHARRGDIAAAMRSFVRYWSGASAWGSLPEEAHCQLLAAVPRILLDMRVAFETSFSREALTSLAVPTLLVCGGRSPSPTRQLALELARRMSGCELAVIGDAGHDLPTSHGEELKDKLLPHLAASSPQGGHAAERPIDLPRFS